MEKPSWEEVARKKSEERETRISSYLNPLNGEDAISAEILAIDDICLLVSLLATGKVKALDVMRSYTSRAAEVHRKTNCFTEVCFDEAIKDATKLDEYFQRNGRVIGPLHGVPITFKDQFDVKGYDTTLGYVARAFKPAENDALVVRILRSLGAVVLAKTNLPQSIMWCETENPLWGLTTFPRNPSFTPGGSTGGEGVLLSLQGSMIGWGTDIGGSIRIPSHINGLWGLKPTSTRLPYMGVPVSTEGQEHVPSSVGPMSRNLKSLTKITQLVIDSKPWVFDPKVTPIPWRQDLFDEIQERPITIGILADDGVVKVHPPIQRVLQELSSKLIAKGHDLVTWDNSGHRECIEIMDLFYTADGGEDIRREVEAGGEPFIPHVNALINRGKPISVYQYWQLNKKKLAAQQAYNNKWNNLKSPTTGSEVDIILMPTMPHTAVPHRTCKWVGYTKVWNFLDYPAMSFPAGFVSASQDCIAPESYEPRNEYDSWNWKLYDPDAMDGFPVGLQIVGRRFEEEKLLGAATIIEKIMQGSP